MKAPEDIAQFLRANPDAAIAHVDTDTAMCGAHSHLDPLLPGGILHRVVEQIPQRA